MTRINRAILLIQIFLFALLERTLTCFERYYTYALDSAFQNQYRQEFIFTFEARQSLLRDSTTTESVIKGNTAVFLVSGSLGATAVSRGVNGLIPSRADDNTQYSCVLGEWHDLVRKTAFNIFASQGNQRAIMQQTTVAVINRKMDDQILNELNTGTITIGAALSVPTISMFMNGRVKLTNASIPWDGNITFCSGASFLAFLEEAPEFSNAQWVDTKPLSGGDNNPSWRDRPMAYRWRNVLLIEHPNIPGKATTSEKAFLFHKNAIGHAANTGLMETPVGYNEEQAYSWARCSIDMGPKLLQNTGVIVYTYDGSIYG